MNKIANSPNKTSSTGENRRRDGENDHFVEGAVVLTFLRLATRAHAVFCATVTLAALLDPYSISPSHTAQVQTLQRTMARFRPGRHSWALVILGAQSGRLCS
jgi:hypothetical protein